jgi:uncharacterized membrane protein YvlD (DUF360 family)
MKKRKFGLFDSIILGLILSIITCTIFWFIFSWIKLKIGYNLTFNDINNFSFYSGLLVWIFSTLISQIFIKSKINKKMKNE